MAKLVTFTTNGYFPDGVGPGFVVPMLRMTEKLTDYLETTVDLVDVLISETR